MINFILNSKQKTDMFFISVFCFSIHLEESMFVVRHNNQIDTAQCYGNEQSVGNAVRKSGIDRNEFFITTKLWGCRGYSDTLKSIENSLKKLDIGYIDLLLIHEPTGNFVEIYHAMEDFYSEGKLKSIGLANFYEENYLKIVKNCQVVPQIN